MAFISFLLFEFSNCKKFYLWDTMLNEKIGLEFGGRDHSTVSTACDKIKEELEKNPNLNNVIKDIKMKLQ